MKNNFQGNKYLKKNGSQKDAEELNDNIFKNSEYEPLYDLFLTEYNDLFENSLSMNSDQLISKLIKNISQLLGKEKFESYSADLIQHLKQKLLEENINPDMEIINSTKKNIGPFLPQLNINNIMAHCEKCYECVHICGQKLFQSKDKNFVICIKCNKIYKNNMIRLFCNSCNEEYFSYTMPEKNKNNFNSREEENYIPVTWAKYHCENYIYDDIKCPKCNSGVFFNNKKKLLKCFECKWEKKAKEQKWICEICGKEFQSKLKEYFKYETKPLYNCIKYAIIKKIIVKPYKCDCCNLDPLKINFTHKNAEKCNGKFYLSYLNKRPVIVCSKCKTIKEVPDMIWVCPRCGIKFNCNGIIYIQKKIKKNLVKNLPKNNLNRTGSHNTIIYKKENSNSKYIIRNKKDFGILNSDFSSDDNNYSLLLANNKNSSVNNKLKRIRSSIGKTKSKELEYIFGNNNSFLEIRNITPQKSLVSDFIPSEIAYLQEDIDNNRERYALSKIENNYFSYTKKRKNINNNNSKEIVRNNTMNNIKLENNKKLLNQIPKNNYYNNNINNRMSSRQQIKPKLRSDLKLQSPEYYEDKINSNSVNNNDMKLVKKRLVFLEPTQEIEPNEYQILEKIGSGSFGKIYKVIWEQNNKKYAMKIMKLKKEKDFENYKNKLNILINFIKKTKSKNVVKVFGTLYEQINQIYKCYVLMELAQSDWEVEIKYRSRHKLYYSESDLMNIIKQLIKSYSLLQKNNITHRDVKPQNILIVNGSYKICDFGEAMVTHGKNGFIHQPIRGSELYMSPILFDALNHHKRDIIHNTYKSDVFSLGMCLLFAATLTFQSLYDVREVKNMKVIENIINNYLFANYSRNIISILIEMLQIEEKKRPDFITLETMFNL